MIRRPPRSTLFPLHDALPIYALRALEEEFGTVIVRRGRSFAGFTPDRKSTRLNSSHLVISYAVFCLKKKTQAQSPSPPSYTNPHASVTAPSDRTTSLCSRATC